MTPVENYTCLTFQTDSNIIQRHLTVTQTLIFNTHKNPVMSDKILAQGDTIFIKRSNGQLQTAIITSIDYESLCVKVEWFEDDETKGKEIHFSNVILLNPEVMIIKPTFAANHSSLESTEEESQSVREKDEKRICRDNRVQSAKIRYGDCNQKHFK